jgi:hypothetical protein
MAVSPEFPYYGGLPTNRYDPVFLCLFIGSKPRIKPVGQGSGLPTN